MALLEWLVNVIQNLRLNSSSIGKVGIPHYPSSLNRKILSGTSIFSNIQTKKQASSRNIKIKLCPYPYSVDSGQAKPTSTKLPGLYRDLE